jgi:hypothetical protein
MAMAGIKRAVAIVLFVLLLTTAASAQTLLRWKLKEGEAFTVEIAQKTDSVVAFGTKSAATTIDLTMTLSWKVARATDSVYQIRQTVERIQQTITTRDAGTVAFDSAAAAGRPTGQAKELAEALKPLVGAEFEMTMTSHGEITSVEPVNEAAKALLGTADAGVDAGSQNTVRQMLRRPLAILPEQAVKAGDTWTSASERATAAGAIKLEAMYQLEGIDGESVARIGTKAKVTPGAGSTTRIKEHEHSGVVRFSLADGRVLDIEQKQKLVTERPYRETTITVTLNSVQTTRLGSQ